MFATDHIWLRLRNVLRVFAGHSKVAQLRLRVAALEQSHAALLNAVPGNVALVDTEGGILAVNDTWRHFAVTNELPAATNFGISSNYFDVCGRSGSEEGELDSAVAAGIRNVLAGTLPVFSREYPCHSATEKDWYRLTVLPIGAPHPTGAVIMHVSVTATKKVEASLSESEAQFHQMAESIRDVFFLVDTRSKRVLYISPAYEELFGHGCAGMYAHSDAWLATVSPATRSRLAAEYRAHTKTSNIRFDCVFEIVRPDQTLRWVALKVFSIRDEAGKVTRIAGVAEDITDTKHAARAVQESEFRMRALLNNIGLVSVMLDCVEKITFCNEAFLRLSGWRREDLIGQNWFTLFMPGEPVRTRQHYTTLLAGEPEKGRHENQIRTRSGDFRTICWSSSIMRARSGEVIGVASLGEDITDQRQEDAKILHLHANLEKLSIRLIEAQEQERISLARELHDELGQRLALLKFDLYQLRGFLAEPDAIRIWGEIDVATATLIGQIRVISVSLRPPALDYLGLESAIRELLERQFANSTTTCVFEYVGLPATIDPVIEIAVYRIVQECITNIVRHARAERVVVEINGGETGRELELIVRDNGVGFNHPTMDSTELHAGGSSGLSGMHERVELLGGVFSADTAVGQGTRIIATFSLRPHA